MRAFKGHLNADRLSNLRAAQVSPCWFLSAPDGRFLAAVWHLGRLVQVVRTSMPIARAERRPRGDDR